MAKFETDLVDIEFNLFDFLKVHEHSDLGKEGISEILNQFQKFCENEIASCREEADRVGVRLENKQVYVPEAFKAANKSYYENGWFGLGLPEEIGGMPAPTSLEVACSTISIGANVAFTMYCGLSKGVFNVINKVGNQEQKDKYLPLMLSGAYGGTMCLTESGAGSDVGANKTTATKRSDGLYSIKGVKIFISSGDNDLYQNIIHLVLARLPGAPEGTKGLSLFIVPKYLIKENGENGTQNNVYCTKIEEKMGLHGSSTCEMTFGQDGECVGELIGKEGEGIVNMFILMNEARLLCGLQGDGQANIAFLVSRKYASERIQFGTEIKNHPDVKRMLLKMRAVSRGMRALNLYTASLFDKKTEESEKEIALLTPICKSYCSEEGFQVCVDAIQVHGGYGYCSEYGVEQFARDCKIATIYEGTNGIQAIDFVMRKILKDGGKTFTEFSGKIIKRLKDMPDGLWAQEVAFMKDSMKQGTEVFLAIGSAAQKNKMNFVLAHASDFLNFCGNLVIGWLLLEQALIAKAKLEEGAVQGDYYQSKIDDFQVFSQHYLSRNASLARRVLDFGISIADLKL